jgi:hypothetical protein
MQNVMAELNLLMLPAPGAEVVTGEAPSKSTPSPVPFLIVRRSGTTATFAALLSIPNEHQPGLAPGTIVTQTAPGHYQIEGLGFSDRFTDEGNFDLRHNSK